MKAILVVLALLGCLALASAVGSSDPIRQEFLEYTQRFNKQYKSRDEYEHRLSVYQQNVADIKAKNARSRFATYGVNEFTDMTKDEFKAKYVSLEKTSTYLQYVNITTPYLGCISIYRPNIEPLSTILKIP
jgi:hypothetical protein